MADLATARREAEEALRNVEREKLVSHIREAERRIEDEPTCPYCGASYYANDVLSLKYDGDSTTDECEQCGRSYKLTLCVTYEYISDPLEAALAAPPEGKP